MVDTTQLKTPGFVLRVVQLVFGIIAFAPIADAAGYSRVDFAIFCGVVTMVFSLALMTCALMGITSVRGLPSLVYDCLFLIFWLSCAAALSASVSALSWWYGSGVDRLRAATAFSWLTWFAFIGSVVCDVLDMRKGVGGSLGPRGEPGPPPAPAGGAGNKGPTGAAVSVASAV